MHTLTISFTEVTPAPAAGYRVTYWPTGFPENAVVIAPNPAASPVVIPGLTGTSYTGTVEAACGGGVYGSSQSFVAFVAGGFTCDCYTVNVLSGGSLTVTYIDCNGLETTDTFLSGQTISTQPGSPAPTIISGDGSFTGPSGCIN